MNNQEILNKIQQIMAICSEITGTLSPGHFQFDANWPEAVAPQLLATDKKFRASQIVGSMGFDFKGKTVLDFGCGDGIIAETIAKETEAKSITAFDPVKDENWTNIQKVDFTDNHEAISNNSYDIIIVCDVLDHLPTNAPVKEAILLMQRLNTLLATDGHMFIRTHPWTSCNGGHLENNKAYAHLFMTDTEFAVNTPPAMHHSRFTRPQATYMHILNEARLTIQRRKIHKTDLSPFFTDELIKKIMNKVWKDLITVVEARKIMAIQYIDYFIENPLVL